MVYEFQETSGKKTLEENHRKDMKMKHFQSDTALYKVDDKNKMIGLSGG